MSGDGRVLRRYLVNIQYRGVQLIWMIVVQGPIALAIGAGRVVWTFFLSSIFSLFFLPLWETVRCILKLLSQRAVRGWSGGAMVLGKLPVPGRPTSLDNSRARAYCSCSRCGWGCLDIFTFIYPFSFLSPSLWETTRYRL